VLALRSAPERLAQLAVPIAATVVGAIYMHHAAVRSDAVHLGQCIQPLLILLLALSGLLAWRRARTLSWAALVLLTLLACVQANSVLARRFRSSGLQLATYSAAGEELQLPITQVLELEAIESFVRRNIALLAAGLPKEKKVPSKEIEQALACIAKYKENPAAHSFSFEEGDENG